MRKNKSMHLRLSPDDLMCLDRLVMAGYYGANRSAVIRRVIVETAQWRLRK